MCGLKRGGNPLLAVRHGLPRRLLAAVQGDHALYS